MVDGREEAGRQPASRMFSHLLASGPARERRSSAAATAAAVVFHGAVIGAVAWMTMASDPSVAPTRLAEQVTEVHFVALPPAPQPATPNAPAERSALREPARHERSAAEPAAARARHFLALAPPEFTPPTVPPPTLAHFASLSAADDGVFGPAVDTLSAAAILRRAPEPTVEQLAAGPPTPSSYTVPPELTNEREIKRALQREYPMFLQESGIGGRVLLWFLIDQTGKVRRFELKESSGRKALDKAALKVATRMHFSPAENYSRKVAVWVVMPILFRIGDAS